MQKYCLFLDLNEERELIDEYKLVANTVESENGNWRINFLN